MLTNSGMYLIREQPRARKQNREKRCRKKKGKTKWVGIIPGILEIGQ